MLQGMSNLLLSIIHSIYQRTGPTLSSLSDRRRQGKGKWYIGKATKQIEAEVGHLATHKEKDLCRSKTPIECHATMSVCCPWHKASGCQTVGPLWRPVYNISSIVLTMGASPLVGGLRGSETWRGLPNEVNVSRGNSDFRGENSFSWAVSGCCEKN